MSYFYCIVGFCLGTFWVFFSLPIYYSLFLLAVLSVVVIVILLFYYVVVFWFPSYCVVLSVALLPYSLGVFNTSISWWSFAGVSVAISLLRSLGLFSVFWPVLTMLYFGYSRFFLRIATFPANFTKLSGLFQGCMVKFKFPAHLRVDHFAHSVVSSVILILC